MPWTPDELVTVKIYYDRDANLSILKDRIIADTSKAMEIDVKLTGDIEKFMENVCGNHCIVA